MKIFAFILACILMVNVFLTGCSATKKSQTIKYQRKLTQYLPSDNTPKASSASTGRIDLSEGPKLKYDANLGPGDLNFDIKIRSPYNDKF